ncbi:uncharacterized protein OCT59_015766 [Rhizophagus irregularis]|uniref:uncharacterized protein n=1 Tax=Rhizophagus irregularis TaxID=588596 RepID=UPI003328DA6E|nr:hypothetical protein OCT59_015766 [Rhizophagus irregularis]
MQFKLEKSTVYQYKIYGLSWKRRTLHSYLVKRGLIRNIDEDDSDESDSQRELEKDHEESQDEDHFRKSETSSEEEEKSSDESEKLINTPGKSFSEHSDNEDVEEWCDRFARAYQTNGLPDDDAQKFRIAEAQLGYGASDWFRTEGATITGWRANDNTDVVMGSPADLARVLELARASEKGYDALKGKFKQEEPEPVVKPKEATKKQDKYDIDDLTRDFARLKASDEAKKLKLIEENRRLRSQGQGYEDYNDEYGDYDELPEEQRSNEKWNQKRRSVEEKNVIEEVEMEKPSMEPGARMYSEVPITKDGSRRLKGVQKKDGTYYYPGRKQREDGT